MFNVFLVFFIEFEKVFAYIYSKKNDAINMLLISETLLHYALHVEYLCVIYFSFRSTHNNEYT